MSAIRQDFLLQPYIYAGSDQQVWDFPLDDFYSSSGKILPTPYGNSDSQHILDIEINNIGALKQFPLLGFGIFQYQDAEIKSDEVFNSLSNNMKKDGYTIGTGAIQLNEKGFTIDNSKITPSY